MPEEDPTPEPPAPPAPEVDPPAPSVESPEDLAADRDKWKHFAREHEKTAKANAEAARKLQEIEDAAKSQAEKDAEARKAADERAERAESELLRMRVATAKGLPAELAARLQGGTEAEMQEDADQLLKALGTAGKASQGSADGGPQGTPQPGQLSRADLQKMTPEQIVEAKAKGQLSHLLGT